MQAQSFTHEGYELKYYTAGNPNNPPIILVHGYTSSHAVWRQTIPILQNDYFCVAIDLLGHGYSGVSSNADYSIAAQGKSVLALADRLVLERFILIGHSMGGQISMCIASMLAPERVMKLVNVDGVVAARLTPFVEENVFKYIRIMHGNPLAIIAEKTYRLLSPRIKPMARYQFASWYYDMDAMVDEFDDWRIDREFATRTGIRHVWWHCMNAIQGLDLTAHLPKIKMETLVIFGEYDNVVPVSDGHLANDNIPNSQLILIDDCGHFPMFEKTEVYLQAIRQFLLT